MIPETDRPIVDATHEIVQLSITEESHIPISAAVRPLSTDTTSEGEALTVIMNSCKVAINNHAGRDVIYHTISALRKL